MISNRLEYLIDLYFSNTITDLQKEELASQVMQLPDGQIEELLEKAWANYTPDAEFPGEISKKIIESIYLQRIPVTGTAAPVINLQRNRRWIWAAAAIAVFAITTGFYIWVKPTQKQTIAKAVTPAKRSIEDVKAGGQKAVLTLADGSQIVLDSASNGLLARQGNAQVMKLQNGKIKYIVDSRTSTATLYNTITTPAGGIYQLTLPDGTKVWLNSTSSIRYPTAFTAKERAIEISGEAYFEVEKDATKPFIAKVNNNTNIKVLGTHFNVKAYTDEAEIKTTLLEGAVNISQGNNKCLLAPGQQARINKNGSIKRVNNADLEEAMAWKNGVFLFNSAGLEDIFRQASRWYNLEVVYEGGVPTDKFSGQISKSVNLANFLKWMKWSDVHFRLEGDKLIVKS